VEATAMIMLAVIAGLYIVTGMWLRKLGEYRALGGFMMFVGFLCVLWAVLVILGLPTP
jgi:hypothetical protein